jgi:hypothetical protein
LLVPRPKGWVLLTLRREVGGSMSAPVPATEFRGRPILVMVALSALSWAVLIGIGMAAWSRALGSEFALKDRAQRHND